MNTKWIGASLLAGAIIVPSAALADVTAGSSRGYGIYVSLQLIGIPILTVPEQPLSQGSAPNPYTESGQVLSVAASALGVASVGTGVIDSAASSDVDGGVGTRFADADSLVDDLAITLVPSALGGPPLLSVAADTIGSDSIVNGDFGGLSAVGSMVLEDLSIAVSGTALNIPINPSPNTVLWDAAGLRIVLNEQSSSVLAGSASISTNALHIELDDVLTTGGLLSGEIIVAHSDAQMTSVVPEPATFVGLAGGLALLSLLRRRPGRR